METKFYWDIKQLYNSHQSNTTIKNSYENTRYGGTYLSSRHLRGWGRSLTVSSMPAWATLLVWGHPELHSETLSPLKNLWRYIKNTYALWVFSFIEKKGQFTSSISRSKKKKKKWFTRTLERIKCTFLEYTSSAM